MERFAFRFRLGSIPVLVEPGFWLMAFLLGMGGSMQTTLAWIAVVFVGVLVHEMGHALMARVFGAQVQVTLYAFGGLTHSSFENAKQPNRWRSALITAAGPAAGFLLGAAVLAFVLLRPVEPEGLAAYVVSALIYVNIGWGLLNLVPVLPLDGGNLLRALLSWPGPEKGMRRTLYVSVVLGGLIVAAGAYNALRGDARYWGWLAMLFGLFTFSSARQLMSMRGAEHDKAQQLHDKAKQAQQALADGDYERARELAEPVTKARTPELRVAGLHLQAAALFQLGRYDQALAVIDRAPPEHTDSLLRGAILLRAGKHEEAVTELRRAVQATGHAQARELLAQALEASGDEQAAREARAPVSPSDLN